MRAVNVLLGAPLAVAVGLGSLVAAGAQDPNKHRAVEAEETYASLEAHPVAASTPRAAVKRKRASVSVKTTRVSGNRVRVHVKTNAKRTVVRAYSRTGKRLTTKTLRHSSSRKWVRATLSKSANTATRLRVTSKRVKLHKRLILLSKVRSVSVRKVSAGTSSPSAFAVEVLALVNKARSVGRKCGSTTYGAAPALKLNSKLSLAAQRHSSDMAKNDYFSHEGRNGSSHADRATAAGYKWSWIGENIAAGYSTASAAMKGWLASPGHCENVMSRSYKELGVGMAKHSNGRYGTYWTQMFGTQR